MDKTTEGRRRSTQAEAVGFWEAFWFWIKLGFINFGGPAGQIAIMHRELVEEKRWVSEGQYLRTLNFCMLLPGPEAQQVATYIGWRLHGTLGGLVAGSFFVIPSVFVLWLLSYLAAAHSTSRRSPVSCTVSSPWSSRSFSKRSSGSASARSTTACSWPSRSWRSSPCTSCRSRSRSWC